MVPEERPAAAASRNARVVLQTAEVRIAEYTMAPGEAHPWHYHSEVSDRVYCLEGVIGIELRTPRETHLLRPGETYEIPPGTVHHVGNPGGATGRYLLVQALGKYDFIRAD
ncbi:MAG: cupin domain-containing protein [Acetobacteraceae bacterium]